MSDDITSWHLRSRANARALHLLPNNLVDLVYDHGARRLYACGVRPTSTTVSVASGRELTGVQIPLTLFAEALGRPLAELRNRFADLGDLPGRGARALTEAAVGGGLPEDTARTLAERIAAFAETHAAIADGLAVAVATRLSAQPVAASMHALAAEYHISLRQLQRRFRRAFGLSLKEYASVARLQRVVEDVGWAGDGARLADVGFGADFYDAAHFADEVRRASGLTPTDLAERRYFTRPSL